MIGSVQHHRALLGLLPSKCDAHVSIIEPFLVGRDGLGRRPGPDAPVWGRSNGRLSIAHGGGAKRDAVRQCRGPGRMETSWWRGDHGVGPRRSPP
jgi:hypothetical protein